MTQAHRQSSGSTNLLVPEHAVPSILLFFLQLLPNRQWSTPHYQPISVFTLTILHIYCINGNSPWLTSLPTPNPPKKAGKIYNYPLPATKQLHISNICIMWQILSAIRPPSPSVWLPCAISILSKSPKIITKEEEPQPQSQQVSFQRQTQVSLSLQGEEP
ncbi:serine/arginine-rich splicing factor 3a isoform X2 [Mugil cephalus]|uniref:serine/arginine-rich splicing factor 3a isoform X2 n=1 Tax=Mugil cephalus TaxID=48193 RepID=UPI001FB84058|nr:serine/arginine-rich splicing factor 3a isoform X2 [Mugil cephalus]